MVFDVVSATAVTALITGSILLRWNPRYWAQQGGPMPSAFQLAVVLAAIAAAGTALAARRWRPLLSTAVVLTAWLTLLVTAWPLAAHALNGFELISTLLLYSVAATEPLPIAAAALAVAEAATVADPHRPVDSLLQMCVALLLACGLGLGVARYRDIGARLREQQDAAARAELDRERIRLARELHDVLAHSMSVVNVQAGYGRFALSRDPAAAEAALAAIQTVSRDAMVEMRGMLAVLREGGESAALAPAPRLTDLPRLLGTCAEAGVTVRVRTSGVVRELPDGVELAAFRIVQEALTNVVKHAHTRSAQVLLEYQDTALTLTVTDAGRGGPAPTSGRSSGFGASGSGHGLAGIAERVGLYEGTADVGPLPGGGWRVRATLPTPPTPGPPSDESLAHDTVPTLASA